MSSKASPSIALILITLNILFFFTLVSANCPPPPVPKPKCPPPSSPPSPSPLSPSPPPVPKPKCPPPSPSPSPSPSPLSPPSPSPSPSSNGTCTLKLGVCADLLNDLLHLVLGTPPVTPCCALLQGLADLEAALCLCTAIKANILGINLNVPVSLSLLLNYCGKNVPSGFQCS